MANTDINLKTMSTENRNPNTMDLDVMSSLDIVKAMNNEDKKVPLAVEQELDNIAKIVDLCIDSLNQGGRIYYIGAGTSGRLGVLDASECPPTFGVSADLFNGLIAGGEKAFLKAVEGAEDSLVLAEEDLKGHNLSSKDMVIGIAASGRTPYVIGGLQYARSIGARTGSVSCNKNSKISGHADVAVEVICGPEVLTGSTRLKAGTAQKLILNMISTATMVRMGKSYQNLMVDVEQTNEKLHVRAVHIIAEATGVSEDLAEKTLAEAGNSAKLAIVMILASCSKEEALERLNKAQGHVRDAIK